MSEVHPDFNIGWDKGFEHGRKMAAIDTAAVLGLVRDCHSVNFHPINPTISTSQPPNKRLVTMSFLVTPEQERNLHAFIASQEEVAA